MGTSLILTLFITVQILKFDIDPIIYYKDMSLKGFYKT